MPKSSRQGYRPSRWPDDLKYIREMVYSPSIPASVLQSIEGTTAKHAGEVVATPPVVIREIQDPRHPAYGQMGLFASKKIPPRTRILDYLGEVHVDERTTSDYDLSLLRIRLNADDIMTRNGVERAFGVSSERSSEYPDHAGPIADVGVRLHHSLLARCVSQVILRRTRKAI